MEAERRSCRRQSKRLPSEVPLELPEPLSGARREEVAGLEDLPDAEALSAWLLDRGVSTADWGSNGTKGVGKLWKELRQGESGLELWRTADGQLQPVRLTHVLRAKVCSPQSWARGIFLFNTWQQFSDGQKRIRNGLLSEKLSTSEVPLEAHLREVCERAVAEEMHRVVGAAFTIGPGSPAPRYDPGERCPVRVESQHFVDSTVEVETSRSFPGLLTMYRLYTVEIICSGLPGFNFNTLEFEPPGKEGTRALKYVHAWSWLEWPQIQRYLFEGSALKERKQRGSFQDAEGLGSWLAQFDLDLETWGQEGCGSLEDLFNEVEREETQLEHWGRDDGVPLLMRVVHVLQLKVKSTDPRLAGKFLFQSWQQAKDGRVRVINRLMSKKLSSAQVPFDEPRFIEAAERAVKKELSHLTEAHFQLHPHRLPEARHFAESGVRVCSTEFTSHHFDIEESPFFRGMHTMYHLYSMELECEGLPPADFTSLDFWGRRAPCVNGWRWVTRPEILDVLHARTRGLERQEAKLQEALDLQRRRVDVSAATLTELASAVERLDGAAPDAGEGGCQPAPDAQRLARAVRQEMRRLAAGLRPGAAEAGALAELLPPSMVSQMASDKIASQAFLEEARMQRGKSLSGGREIVQGACGGCATDGRPPGGATDCLRPLQARPRSAKLAVAVGVCAAQVVVGSALLADAPSGSCVLGVRLLLLGAVSVGSLLLLM